jgi:hypothetical protein
MEGISAIHQFYILKVQVEVELFFRFVPIIFEVKRQDTKNLLCPPILETLGVKWLVMNPKGIFPPFYRYLILGHSQNNRSKKLEMVLCECQMAMPQDLYIDVFMNNYRNKEDITIEDFQKLKSVNPVSIDDMLQNIKPILDISPNPRICPPLERFFLDGEIDAAAVAERIITEARRIYKEQKKIANMCRKDCEERRAKARNKPALVF